MALVAKLSAVDTARTGRLKYIAVYSGSFTGIQEVEPGWLLCNGVTIPSSGAAPSGANYGPLYTALGTKFGGAGILPSITNGRMIIGKGTNGSRVFTVGQAADYNTNGTITLTTSNMPNHRHGFTVVSPGNDGASAYYSDGYGSEPFTSSVQTGRQWQTSGAQGGGGSHNNMGPYLTFGAVLVKL